MKSNKKILIILMFTVCGLVLICNSLSSQQTAGELFEKALYLEEAQGDLQKAIELFDQILKQFPDNREIAAKAQLHIGLCFEKLGLQEAPKAFQKVLDDFPEQKEAVKMAQEKLSVFRKAQSVVTKTEKEFNIRKIWANPLTDTCGAPSPDGKFLSFVDWMTGDLAIRDLSSGKKRRLTDKGSWAESQQFALLSKWSPDSGHIVYNWLNEEDFFDLRIVSLDTQKSRILYSNKKEYIHPSGWSPDGKNILAFVSSEQDFPRVGLISVEDGFFREIKDFDSMEIIDYTPTFSFSPDGRYIAFSFPQGEGTQQRDIFLYSLDKKQESTLIVHPANDNLLGWSPDGNRILFASDRTGTTDAWIVRVDNGKLIQAPEMIKKDLGQIEPLGFTRNGAFFYGVSNQMVDIYSIEIDSDSGKILSPPTKATQRYEGSNSSPAYSADGNYLAYISKRGLGPRSRNVLCIHEMKTGKEREINLKANRLNYPRWSPDGCFISVEARDDSNTTDCIYRIDVQTDALDQIVLPEPGTVIYSHRWSKDGKSIFYTGSDPDAKGPTFSRSSRIFVHDIARYQDTVLSGSPTDAKDIDISPDGQWLVLLNRDEKRLLRIIPTSGGESRDIYSFEQKSNFIISPTWIAGGKYILFYQASPDSIGAETTCELVRIPAMGGEPQKLGLVMKEFRHFSVHPDGQHIVFYSMGSKIRWPEIWVMENFLPKK